MWYVYRMEYPSAIKNNEILLLTTPCTWKVLCLQKYQTPYFITYMLNLKNKKKLMNTTKQKNTHKVQTHGYQRDEGRGKTGVGDKEL